MFRKLVHTPGAIETTAEGMTVRLSKRVHYPQCREAGLTQPTRSVPWLSRRYVRLECP